MTDHVFLMIAIIIMSDKHWIRTESRIDEPMLEEVPLPAPVPDVLAERFIAIEHLGCGEDVVSF